MRSCLASVVLLGLGATVGLAGCGGSESQPKSIATAGSAQSAGSGGTTTSPSAGAGTSTGGSGSNSSGNGGGGAPGTGGSGPIVIAPPVDCSKLSTVVGTWQNISPPELLNPTNIENFTVVVSPKDGTVFTTGGNLTNGAACGDCPQAFTGILRSNDCGATFKKVNENASGTAGANLETGVLWAMLIDSEQPQTLYVANGYGTNPTMYKSTDGGITWRALKTDPDDNLHFVQAIAISPFNHNHIALTYHEDCKAPRTPACLSRSLDGGETWKVFDGPKQAPGWMEGASVSILGENSYVLSATAGIFYTGDSGVTWTQLAKDVIYGSYPGTTAIAGGTLFIAGDGHVWSSPAAAGDPPFELGTSKQVKQLPNSPLVASFVSDGVTLFAGSNREGEQPMWTMPLSDPSGWKQMPDKICGAKQCRGPNQMAYDPVHHIIYSANWGAGLWRYVIK